MEMLRRTWFEDVPDDELLLRDLKQLKVPELGPVAWPAYDDTSVSVRSKTITIDLGHLDDPEQRKTLARAVFLADVAEASGPQHATDEAGESGDTTEEGEQRATDDESAGERSDVEDDSQSITGDQAPADEHDTADPESVRAPEALHGLGDADWYLPASGDEAYSTVI
jgi:hypothetical protein